LLIFAFTGIIFIITVCPGCAETKKFKQAQPAVGGPTARGFFVFTAAATRGLFN
jgi:hypothetical protein